MSPFFSCPSCNKRIRWKSTLAGAERPCPFCEDLIWVPENPENEEYAETDGEPSDRPLARRRRRSRWPWFVGAIIVLLALGAGLAYYLGFLGPKRPEVWKDATVAKVTLVITEDNVSQQPVKFPEHDFAGEHKKDLLARLKAMTANKWEHARHLQLMEVKKKGGGPEITLEVTFYLFAERETNWPKDGPELQAEFWGSRIDKGMFFYDLKLDGRQQEDGSFKGKAGGRVQMVKNDWIKFHDADFALQPWTIKEVNPSSVGK